ncbi:C69 family dipeptidase [Treponema parvum]|uniref:Dipeptidase n=1 Tax=Treponema parvum TaxID=138851 RepID=A0A975IEB3_9SPIR|nr:C69 family dipeptidase [Treponema parvum]QTQ13875.1 C69 family dipeptidase [Treponema parvum]
MCFSIIAGKNATTTGNVLVGVNNDWPGYPGHIHFVPRKQHARDAVYTLSNGIKIPQVETTNAYTHTTTAYETGHYSESWWGGVNEHQVSVGMQGVYSFKSFTSKPGLEADDLTILVLERGKTARQSIEMLGELIEKYGFGVSAIEGAAGCCNISVADPNEGFFLEVAPGGIWCAKRVADDEAECRPNCFGTQVIDFDDPVNFLWSKNIVSHAVEQGWYDDKSGKPFNFYEIYSDNDSINEFGKASDPVNAYRRWRAVNLVSGKDFALEDMVYGAKVNRKLSVRDIADLISDSSEGSKYDLSKAPEAGQFKNPFWMETSTSVGWAGTVVSMVVEFRRDMPKEIGTLAWFSYGNTLISPFLPCYLGSEGMPHAYSIGEINEFDPKSAWWTFQDVGQLCYRNYQKIAKEWIIPVFRQFETEQFEVQPDLEAFLIKLYEKNPEAAKRLMRTYTHSQANTAMELAQQLSKEIKGRFLANTIIE